MATGVLTPRCVFGVKGNVRNNVHYVEDNVVVYPAGHYVTKFYAGTRQQEFLACDETSGGVTAMALSGSRRYVAVAERFESGDGAAVSVYNVRTLSKRRTMRAAPHVRATEFAAISFNLDDTLILALGNAPAYQLALFHVERGVCIGTANVITPAVTALTQIGSLPLPFACSFSPISLTKGVVWGRNVLVFYSIDELPGAAAEAAASDASAITAAAAGAGAGAGVAAAGAGTAGGDAAAAAAPRKLTHTITALPQNMAFQTRALRSGSSSPATSYCAQCWLGDDISLVSTADGELLVFKRNEFVKVLDESPKDHHSIDALVAFSRGFLAGGEGGLVRIYEAADPDDTTRFNCVKTLRLTAPGLDCEDRIRSIAVSPSEESAAIAVSGCQLFTLDLAHANVKDDSNAFTPLGPASHAPPTGNGCGPGYRNETCAILSMDVAVRKPLVVTVGVDNAVRVWNHVERTCEVFKVFPEGPTAVAIHPAGFQLLVGFVDKLRLLNILMDDIREVKDFPIKSCSEVRFSRGGAMFAAANGNVIMLYDAYTGRYQCTLRGHNGRVTGLQWAYNDATLVSCSADGTVYEWDISDAKRARDYIAKGVRWAGIAALKDGGSIYGVGEGAGAEGTDYALREADMNSGATTREIVLSAPQGAVVVTLSNPRMLFTGSTGDGRIGVVRSYAMPLSDAPAVTDYAATSGGIVRMMPSHDDTHLFVAGLDGSLVVYEVRDRDGRLPISDYSVKVPWSDEVMVTVSDLEDKKAAVHDLRDKVAELQSNNDYAMRMMDIGFQERLKKITERYTGELEAERQQYDLLREEKLDMEREYTERLNAMEIAHRSEMQKRESLYQGKIMEEVERYQTLQSDVDSQRTMWQNKRNAMVAAHAQYLAQLTSDYERRLESVRDRRHELEHEVENVKGDWTEMRRQMEGDLDKEVEGMKRGYQEKLDSERDATLKFKGENGIMMKKFAALSKEMDEVSEEIKRMGDKQKGLRLQIAELEKEIGVLKLMMHEKDVAIGEKDKRIYELKKKNQELEKFKFVLDYKIKELKQQIEPRENEITAMRKQIRDVDAELESYHKSNAKLDELIGRLRSQLDALQTQAGKLRSSLLRKEASVKDFSSSLHDVVHSSRTPEELQAAIDRLHGTHVKAEHLTESGDASVITESERQREHLATTVRELKRSAETASAEHRRANLQLVEENMNLIGQIKALRDQVTSLRTAQRLWALDRPRAVSLLVSAGVISVDTAMALGGGVGGGLHMASTSAAGAAAVPPFTAAGSMRSLATAGGLIPPTTAGAGVGVGAGAGAGVTTPHFAHGGRSGVATAGRRSGAASDGVASAVALASAYPGTASAAAGAGLPAAAVTARRVTTAVGAGLAGASRGRLRTGVAFGTTGDGAGSTSPLASGSAMIAAASAADGEVAVTAPDFVATGVAPAMKPRPQLHRESSGEGGGGSGIGGPRSPTVSGRAAVASDGAAI